jgi:hypothetical protein
MSEQLQNMFFSKDTIAGLNKIIVQQSNYQNLSREGKEKLINILIKNMKTVYRSLDATKINKDNFGSIFDQFKKHSVIESIGEIKKTNVLTNLQQSSSDLKFERDFKSNPNPGNKFMDRPESTKIQVNNLEKKKEEQINNSLSGFSADKNNYESSLDQAFKPIVDNLTDQDYFNNYDTGRNVQDINSRMEGIQQMRQNEVGTRNQKPPTPEFLKSKKTNMDKIDNDNKSDYRVANQSLNQPNGKIDFQNMKSSDFNKGFHGLANDTGDNLMSLDNIDKPLIDQEMIEDTTNFEDRLKRLQSDRDNLKIPQTGDKIDFTSENFPQSDINSNNINYQSNIKPNNNQPNYDSNINQQQMRPNNQPNYDSNINQQQMRPNNQPNYDSNINQQQMRPNNQDQNKVKLNNAEIEAKRNEMIREVELRKRNEMRKDSEMRASTKYNLHDSNDKFNEIRNNMKTVNIDLKEDVIKINNMKQQIEEMQNEIINLKEENLKFKQNNDYEKINGIKNQIAHEFEILNTKNSNIDTRTAELNLKELEINKKDCELKQLIKDYDYLFRTHQLQIEVTNSNNESKYSYPLEKVNAIGIKLMSYSIPNPIFNIEENKNNELKLLYKNEEIILNIPMGKYNIDELIEILNIELKNKNLDELINFKLNKQQKVLLELTNCDDEISIISTELSKENLGFISPIENKQIHIADRIWDLRMIDKVYLFLNNL